MKFKVSLFFKEITNTGIIDSKIELFSAQKITYFPQEYIELITDDNTIRFDFEEQFLKDKFIKLYVLNKDFKKYTIGQLYVDSSLALNFDNNTHETTFYQVNFMRTTWA